MSALTPSLTPEENHPAITDKGDTYTIFRSESGVECILCHDCGMTSYNPGDIKNFYCGHCHETHPHKSMMRRLTFGSA
jgi:hypothetical protein